MLFRIAANAAALTIIFLGACQVREPHRIPDSSVHGRLATAGMNKLREDFNKGACQSIFEDADMVFQLLQSPEDWSNKCEQMRGKLGLWKGFDAKYFEGSQTPISVSAYGQVLFTTGGTYHLWIDWHINGGRARLFRVVFQRNGESIVIPQSPVRSHPFVDPPSIRERELGIKHG